MHAALGDPGRLAIVDALLLGEASPTELQRLLAMPSNLLAHHVRVLERAGVVSRHRSEADRRRTYLALAPGAFDALRPSKVHDAVRVVFVCTHNSARSQLAAALWNDTSPVPGDLGGHPSGAARCTPARSRRRTGTAFRWPRLRRGTSTTSAQHARRPGHHGLRRRPRGTRRQRRPCASPRRGGCTGRFPTRPAPGRTSAFDRVVTDLTDRIARVAPAVRPAAPVDPETGGPDAG